MIPAQAAIDAKTAQIRTGASDLAAALALAGAGPESGWNPGAMGDYMLGGQIVGRNTPGAVATSFGYTQLHTSWGGDGGGLGNGHSLGELLDGPTNFAIAISYIQGRLDGGADGYSALSPWSARAAGMANLTEALEALGAAPAATIGTGISVAGWLIAGLALLVILEIGG